MKNLVFLFVFSFFFLNGYAQSHTEEYQGHIVNVTSPLTLDTSSIMFHVFVARSYLLYQSCQKLSRHVESSVGKLRIKRKSKGNNFSLEIGNGDWRLCGGKDYNYSIESSGLVTVRDCSKKNTDSTRVLVIFHISEENMNMALYQFSLINFPENEYFVDLEKFQREFIGIANEALDLIIPKMDTLLKKYELEGFD